MTQRERVLYELQEAGSKGVRSDRFFELHLPRAAARILELKDAGHEISSTREGKFTRYTLAEVGAVGGVSPGNAGLAGNDRPASADLNKELDATSDGNSLAVGVNTAEGGDPSTLPFAGDTPSASLFKKRPGNAFTDPEWA